MQRILTAEQMREVDRVTIEDRGVASTVLMENAGSRVFEWLAHRYEPLAEQRILVLCGKGNNGGDGLVVARHLATRGHGADVKIILFGEPDNLTGDAAANYCMLRAVDVQPTVVTRLEEWRAQVPSLLSATIVVDALLGTGLKGPARGLLLDVIRDLNSRFRRSRMVAVDMPSGLGSDSGTVDGETVQAHETVTFTAPKVSQILPPSCERVGHLEVAPIGTARSVLESNPELRLLLPGSSDFAPLFASRKRTAHKGDFGHVLIVAGSSAKPGAAVMAGTAALRSGAGLVTVATAADAVSSIVSHTPELMTQPVEEIEDGSMSANGFRKSWFERKTVVATGPGVGTKGPNRELVRHILAACELPLVIDADGLTALAEMGDEPWKPRSPLIVLTPHPGEMSRLTGLETGEIQQRRVEVARDFARKRGVVLVLKGYRTVVAAPDGRVLVNPTGTPALAKGGAGDILTGIIAGFLAQFPDQPPEIVIAAAVYLHGLAAELAAGESTEHTLLATDLLQYLPHAIRSVRLQRD